MGRKVTPNPKGDRNQGGWGFRCVAAGIAAVFAGVLLFPEFLQVDHLFCEPAAR